MVLVVKGYLIAGFNGLSVWFEYFFGLCLSVAKSRPLMILDLKTVHGG